MPITTLLQSHLPQVELLIKASILASYKEGYSSEAIKFLIKIEPLRPRETMHERDYFVYIDDEEHVCGIIGKQNNEVKTFFVNPDFHGHGIGKELLSYIEKLISNNESKLTTVYSSLSAKTFYEKQGYKVIREEESDNVLRYYMEKEL